MFSKQGDNKNPGKYIYWGECNVYIKYLSTVLLVIGVLKFLQLFGETINF